MIRALTALLIALLLAPGMAGPAEAADGRGRFGIRLMDAPVSRRNDPRAHYQIVDHLRPGATIRRRIQVSNDSAAPLRIAMGVSPAEIRENRFTVTDGAAANELPGWISFDPGSFEVPPYGRTVVRATIRVPDSAPEGERYGVIWAETGAPASGAHNVGVVARVGIRVYLDIGPGGEPPSDFRIERLIPARTDDGRPQVLALVRNTGERALEMSGSLTLSNGPGGLRAGPFTAAPGTALAPGDQAQVRVVLDRRLPAGPWGVRLELASGRIRRTATATLTFPDDPGSMGRAVSFERGMPWLILGALGLLILGTAIFMFAMRRKRTAR